MEKSDVNKYIDDLNIKVDELPLFAYLIFQTPLFSDKDKMKIKNKFLIKYLNDESFQNEYENWHFVFINRIFNGLYDNVEFENMDKDDAEKLDFTIGKDEIMTVEINKNPIIYSLYNCGQVTVKCNGKDNTYDEFRVACKLIDGENEFQDEYTVDSGAFKTVFPELKMWHYINCNYNYKNLGMRPDLSTINDALIRKRLIATKNIGHSQEFWEIFFNRDFYFSIGDLPKIKITSLIAPQYDINMSQLLGRDIICKHTMLLSSTNDKVDIKFFANESINPCQNRFVSKITKMIL